MRRVEKSAWFSYSLHFVQLRKTSIFLELPQVVVTGALRRRVVFAYAAVALVEAAERFRPDPPPLQRITAGTSVTGQSPNVDLVCWQMVHRMVLCINTVVEKPGGPGI